MTLAKNPGVHVSSTRNPYVVSCTVGMWNTFAQTAPAQELGEDHEENDIETRIQTTQKRIRHLQMAIDAAKIKLESLYEEKRSKSDEELAPPTNNFKEYYERSWRP